MRLKPGQKAPDIVAETYEGEAFKLSELKGRKVFVTFFRFASCPFCNLRLNQMMHTDGLTDRISLVALFESTKENMQRYAPKHQAPFPMLCDRERRWYKAYGVEKSFIGMVKGMIFRLPTLLYSMLVKGNLPLRVDASMARMPAGFLLDEQGIIQAVHYGADEGDHMSLQQVLQFAGA